MWRFPPAHREPGGSTASGIMTKRPALHPGIVLLHRYLKPQRISLSALARATGIPSRHYGAIVKGRRPITQDVAVRLAAYLDVPAIFWMRMQKHYDEWQEYKALLREGGVDIDAPRK